MNYFNGALSALLDFLLSPLGILGPAWALAVISLLAGVLMLLIFRRTSNQARIKEAKDKMQGHLMEVLLFKDSPRIILTALKNLVRYNGLYLRYAFTPLVYMILPVSLLLVHLDGWFGYRPLQVGESAIFSVTLSPDGPRVMSRVSIETDKGLTIETPPLRILQNGEIDWRIRAEAPGEHLITVNASGHKVRKKIQVSETKLTRLSKVMVGSSFLDVLLNPGEGPIEQGSFIHSITVGYPAREIEFLGWRSHWLVLFFILSLAGGFAFKKVLKTEI